MGPRDRAQRVVPVVGPEVASQVAACNGVRRRLAGHGDHVPRRQRAPMHAASRGEHVRREGAKPSISRNATRHCNVGASSSTPARECELIALADGNAGPCLYRTVVDIGIEIAAGDRHQA